MHRRGSRNRFGRLSTRLRLAVLAGGLGAIALSCANEPAEAQSSAAATTSADRSEDLKSSTSPTLTPQQSGTTNRLQAISPVNARVVWASGVGGTFALTTDGGATWHSRVVPGAETLQFRDVQGISERVAYLLSSGVGTDSRIYKTEDGGDTWTLQFENQDPNGFYDCFSFWTPRRGITMADSVNGRFPVILTRNGKTWQDIGDQLPAAQAGEAAFAASGTCIATQGGKRAWIATGAATKARISPPPMEERPGLPTTHPSSRGPPARAASASPFAIHTTASWAVGSWPLPPSSRTTSPGPGMGGRLGSWAPALRARARSTA